MRETEKLLRGTESTNTVCEFGGRTEPSERGDSCFGLSGGPDSPGSTCGTCLLPTPPGPAQWAGVIRKRCLPRADLHIPRTAARFAWCPGPGLVPGSPQTRGCCSPTRWQQRSGQEQLGNGRGDRNRHGAAVRGGGDGDTLRECEPAKRGLASALAAGCSRCTPEAVRGLAPSGRDGRLCTGRERNRVRGIIEDLRKDLLFGRASTSGLSWAPAER